MLRTEADFPTTWESLKAAVNWVLRRLAEQIDKPPSAGELTYTLESTGCYHIPVILAFGGVPRVVNPVLAGATKRKTDVLDARLLAYHAITGMWPATFFVRQEVQTLRVCVQLRRRTEVERSNDSRCRE